MFLPTGKFLPSPGKKSADTLDCICYEMAKFNSKKNAKLIHYLKKLSLVRLITVWNSNIHFKSCQRINFPFQKGTWDSKLGDEPTYHTWFYDLHGGRTEYVITIALVNPFLFSYLLSFLFFSFLSVLILYFFLSLFLLYLFLSIYLSFFS